MSAATRRRNRWSIARCCRRSCGGRGCRRWGGWRASTRRTRAAAPPASAPGAGSAPVRAPRPVAKAGADVIQLDEPWVRNNPDLARRYAVKAINRALEGITVPTVVHLCFGYAAVVPGSTKPAGYSFLAELADTSAEQISIEAAQPKLDLGVLSDLSSKKIMLGVLDLGNPEIETAEIVADRIRNGLRHVAADRLVVAPDCGMKYMPRHTAFGKLKAMCDAAATVRKEIS